MKKLVLKNVLTKKNIFSFLLYALTAVMLLISIGLVSEIVYDYQYQHRKNEGYQEQDLSMDFFDGRYYEMYQKVAYNRGRGTEATQEMQEYYAFADCFVSAMNYHMYSENGDLKQAQNSFEKIQEKLPRMKHKVLLDAWNQVRELYQVPTK